MAGARRIERSEQVVGRWVPLVGWQSGWPDASVVASEKLTYINNKVEGKRLSNLRDEFFWWP
jgi:hypothetical protein